MENNQKEKQNLEQITNKDNSYRSLPTKFLTHFPPRTIYYGIMAFVGASSSMEEFITAGTAICILETGFQLYTFSERLGQPYYNRQ